METGNSSGSSKSWNRKCLPGLYPHLEVMRQIQVRLEIPWEILPFSVVLLGYHGKEKRSKNIPSNGIKLTWKKMEKIVWIAKNPLQSVKK